MFDLSPAWASALVACLLGTLPGRSFRFRVVLVALVVSVGIAVPFAFATFWIANLFDGNKLPNDVNPGEWAKAGLYFPLLVQWLGHLLMVGVAYFIRQRLLPLGGKDTRTRKLLAFGSALAIVLVVVVPLSFGTDLLNTVRVVLKAFS